MSRSWEAVSREARNAGAVGSSALWHFFVGFLKHPMRVGAIAPPGRALVEKMLEPIQWWNCKLFVEYGPGIGTFTEVVLERMSPDATLIAIDTNEHFTSYLRHRFTDNRLRVIAGSACDVREIIAASGFGHADYVLAGLPFSTLPLGVGDRIAEETYEALRPGGVFLTYQFSTKVRQFLTRRFECVDRGFEWVNIPPCHLFWAYRSEPDTRSAPRVLPAISRQEPDFKRSTSPEPFESDLEGGIHLLSLWSEVSASLKNAGSEEVQLLAAEMVSLQRHAVSLSRSLDETLEYVSQRCAAIERVD